MADIFRHYLSSHRDQVKHVVEGKPRQSLEEVNLSVIKAYNEQKDSESDKFLAWPKKNSVSDTTHQTVVQKTIVKYTKEIDQLLANEEPPRLVDLPKWVALIALEIVNTQGSVNLNVLNKVCETKFKVVPNNTFKEGIRVAEAYINKGNEGVVREDAHRHLREDS